MSKLTEADKSVLRGAEQALAHVRGKKETGRTHFVITAEIDVKAIRKNLGMTQKAFAETYGVPLGTLKNWEGGHRKPDGAAKAYLLVINERPNVVRKALSTAVAA